MSETATRRIVRERSDGVCEQCGQSRATDMAHRLARSRMGRWQPSNVLHLCARDHAAQRDGRGGEDLATALGQVLPSMVDGHRPDPRLIPVATRYGWVFLDDDGAWTRAEDVL